MFFWNNEFDEFSDGVEEGYFSWGLSAAELDFIPGDLFSSDNISFDEFSADVEEGLKKDDGSSDSCGEFLIIV